MISHFFLNNGHELLFETVINVFLKLFRGIHKPLSYVEDPYVDFDQVFQQYLSQKVCIGVIVFYQLIGFIFLYLVVSVCAGNGFASQAHS